MADLGTIGTTPSPVGFCVGQYNLIHPIMPRLIRVLLDDGHPLGSGRTDADGSPAAPALTMPGGGSLRFRVAVDEGSRSVSIRVKQPSAELDRPTMRILANDAVGISSTLTATAPNGADWVTVGPINFVATAAGGIVVELTAPYLGGEAGAIWDTLAVQ